jgi:hypothetical protein
MADVIPSRGEAEAEQKGKVGPFDEGVRVQGEIEAIPGPKARLLLHGGRDPFQEVEGRREGEIADPAGGKGVVRFVFMTPDRLDGTALGDFEPGGEEEFDAQRRREDLVLPLRSDLEA